MARINWHRAGQRDRMRRRGVEHVRDAPGIMTPLLRPRLEASQNVSNRHKTSPVTPQAATPKDQAAAFLRWRQARKPDGE
jgi:hypothetical protein